MQAEPLTKHRIGCLNEKHQRRSFYPSGCRCLPRIPPCPLRRYRKHPLPSSLLHLRQNRHAPPSVCRLCSVRTSVTITTASAITMKTTAATSRPYRLVPAFQNTGTQGFEDGTALVAVAASTALLETATWSQRAQKPPHSRFNPLRSEFSRLSRFDDCQHSHRLRLNRGALAVCRGRLGGVKIQRVKTVIDATTFTRTRGLCTF